MTDRSQIANLNGVAPLSHLGVIQVEGEETAKFIHSQLTHDFALLGQDRARLAAFCNAKGRMQASFIGFKRPGGDILLVCSRDILAFTMKRLSMFVMRAKVRLTDASTLFELFGLAGNAIYSVASHTTSVWAKSDFLGSTLVNLYPADGVARQLLLSPVGATPPQGAPLSEELWAWSEVRSGVATITAPVVEAFVPQMLNFESVDGVNFKKGCYPGQEVVARSQFRGTLKRRALIAHCDGPVAVGAEVFFAAEDEAQSVGMVVQAAPHPEGGFDAIVSLQLSALNRGTLHMERPDGPLLQLLALPYPLIEDI